MRHNIKLKAGQEYLMLIWQQDTHEYKFSLKHCDLWFWLCCNEDFTSHIVVYIFIWVAACTECHSLSVFLANLHIYWFYQLVCAAALSACCPFPLHSCSLLMSVCMVMLMHTDNYCSSSDCCMISAVLCGLFLKLLYVGLSTGTTCSSSMPRNAKMVVNVNCRKAVVINRATKWRVKHLRCGSNKKPSLGQ